MPAASASAPSVLVCDKCTIVLSGAVLNTVEPVACPGCQAPLIAQVFPAFLRPVATGQAAENVGSDEDASCFYHPTKKAVVPCTRCGRFLCALCDIDLGGNRHVCPGCVEAARLDAAGKQDRTAAGALILQRKVLYDTLALMLAALPLTVVVWWTSFVTAPVALYLTIRYWKEPTRGIFPRTRFRFVLAAVLALLQIGGWITLGVYLFTQRTHGLG